MLIEFAEDMLNRNLVDTWDDGPRFKEIQLAEMICLSFLKILVKFN